MFAFVAGVTAMTVMGGQVVIDFSVPDYSPEGRLKTHVRGDYAVIARNGDADIENLQLDIFPENGQNITIVAPTCRYLQQRGILESDSDVLIETSGLLMRGTGFSWMLQEEKGVLKSNVTFKIKNIKGLYPRER